MSSRYRRLNLRERAFAPCHFKALLAGGGRIARGERNAVAIKEHAGQVLHVFPAIKMNISIWWIPKPFDPSMSSRDRWQLRWRYGLARPDSSIAFLVNPALPIEPHKNHSEFADTQPKQLTTSLPGCRQS